MHECSILSETRQLIIYSYFFLDTTNPRAKSRMNLGTGESVTRVLNHTPQFIIQGRQTCLVPRLDDSLSRLKIQTAKPG